MDASSYWTVKSASNKQTKTQETSTVCVIIEMFYMWTAPSSYASNASILQLNSNKIKTFIFRPYFIHVHCSSYNVHTP